MPVKRRKDRRREAETLDKWECAFSAEFDFFRELPTIGVELDEYDKPPREVARAAWLRFGPAYLELPRHPDLGPSWAESTFGRPWEASNAR